MVRAVAGDVEPGAEEVVRDEEAIEERVYRAVSLILIGRKTPTGATFDASAHVSQRLLERGAA